MTETVQILFDPLVSWPVYWGVTGLAVIMLALYLIVYARAWLSRTGAIGLILLALANPSLVEEKREALPSIVGLVLDESESMRFGNRSAIADDAFSTVRSFLEQQAGLELRTLRVSEQQERTQLIRAMQTLMADVPRDRIAGTILITDGQVHDVPDTPDSLLELGPIHALITGDPEAGDRHISLVETPGFGIVGNPAEFIVRIEDPAQDSARIVWSVNGGVSQTRRIPTGEDVSLAIETERRGENIVVFETPAGPEELTLVNNRTAALISGVRDGLRVLLVTGQPNASGRVWRDLLKSDPSVDLVHFTILRPPLKQNSTPLEEMALIAFPTDQLFEDKLGSFDLIVFDQYERRGVITLSYLADVARYVDEGGALLVVAGESFAGPGSLAYTPLAGILPALPTGDIRIGAIKPGRSELGRRHTITEALPDDDWGQWLRYIEAEAKTGDVLIVTPDNDPLLSVDRVGEGRVALLLSDHIWLWARQYDGGGPFADLIRRTVHWLMKEPELDERRLRLNLLNESIRVELRTLADQAPPLTLEAPDGQILEADWQAGTPGTYLAEVQAEQIGLYRARAGGLETVILNGPPNPVEFAQLDVSADLLRPLISATGGGIFSIQALGRPLPEIRQNSSKAPWSGPGWLGLRQRDAYAVRDTAVMPLLPGLLLVSGLLLFLILAWHREGC